jgi:hypothetical protein
VVVPRGIDPRSSPYRGEALPLSYGTNLVRLAGVEPAASAMSTRRSSVELEARAPGPIRTDEMSVCKTDAFGHLATRANWCALGKIRTSTVRGLKPPPPTVGLPARTRGGHRTRTFRRLRPGLCRLGYAGELVRREGFEPALSSEGSASCQLGYRRKNGAPRKSRTCLSALPKR